MDKSPEAFRTISEVAEALETSAHVLRFWETRFPQIRPVKRAGGRRYYRPNDVALLTGIKYLLHAEGMTIRGVQKVLRDQGVRHVAGLIGAEIQDIAEDAEAALSAALSANFGIVAENTQQQPEQAESATIVALETALRRQAPARSPDKPATITPIDRIFANTDSPRLPGFEDDPLPAPPADLPLTTRLNALPAGCLAASTSARDILRRAAALHARLTQNPLAGAL
jgi:DNA-binding transcriptional MerR regulator